MQIYKKVKLSDKFYLDFLNLKQNYITKFIFTQILNKECQPTPPFSSLQKELQDSTSRSKSPSAISA